MQIVIDQNIPGYEETFARHGEVLQVDGRKLTKQQLCDAKVLIVRSVTRVDAALLAGSPVRFVGTATIGTDHLDIPWLERHGIIWAGAPGCNADAAAQYTLAMMMLAGKRIGFELAACSIGVVGYGNVGSHLCRLLTAFGVRSLTVNDPLKASTGQCGLSSLDHIKQCDVVSFHVPLSTAGPFATEGMIDSGFLDCLKPHTLLVNTSRGRVTENGLYTTGSCADGVLQLSMFIPTNLKLNRD
jgi:erythronate-4-phosphate dehydrogenase